MFLTTPFRTLLCTAVAVTLGLAAREANAALLVYEGFDYSSSSGPDLNDDGKFDLNGRNGGVGFSGAWVEASNNAPTPADQLYDYIQSGSIAPPSVASDLWTTGNSLRVIYASDSMDSDLSREIPVIEGTAGRTLWVSFLMRRDLRTAPIPDMGLFLKLSPSLDSRYGFRIGDLFTETNYGISGYMPTGPGGGQVDSTATSSVVPALNVPVLLVLRIDFAAGNDRFELFVNPTPGGQPTPSGVTLTDVDLPSIGAIGIQATGANLTGREWSVDEIRIGDTYGDVTPTTVPEPSAALLLGVAGVGMLGFRRSRSTRL